MVASSVLSRWSLSVAVRRRRPAQLLGALALAGLLSACQQSEKGGSVGNPGGGGPTGGSPQGGGAGTLGGSSGAGGGSAGSGGVPAIGGAGGAEASAAGGTSVVIEAGADRPEASGMAAGSDAAADGASVVSGLPARSAVLDALRNANAYFVAKWPDPTIDIVTDRARPSNLWTRAVYYEGLMGLYAVETDTARRTSYYNYAVTWAATPSRPWLGNTATTAVDANFQACGQTYIDLYRIDPQPVRIANIQANVDFMVSGRIANAWTWVDAVQMSMPVFAKLGALLGNTAYFDAMWALYSDARNTEGGGMYNAQSGLWWRDLNFTPDAPTYTRSPNGQDIYWSRGNGWLMAALARVLDAIPSTETHRAQYIADFRAMAAALVPIQRSDGFWNESLTNPMHCQSVGKTGQDGPETSGTALFTFGLAFGIRTGLLDAGTYGPVLARAWNGLVTTALRANGFLGWVQSTGAAPCEAADTIGLGANVTPNFEDYGLGAFLLAGSEVYKLAP